MDNQYISPHVVITAFRNTLEESISKGSNLAFNCPHCEDVLGNERNKHNLEVNCENGIYHCWSCNDSGTLYSLAVKYGDKEYLKYFPKKVTLDWKPNKEKSTKELKLPFPNLKTLTKEQVEYLINFRGINKDIIRKFDIRSFNGQFLFIGRDSISGEVNYWVVHDWKNSKYIKPKEISLTDVCMFEHLINPELPIILVEGIYDALVLPNAIPLLGITLNKRVRSFLEGKKKVLVFVDSSVKLQQKRKYLLTPLKSFVYEVQDIGEMIKEGGYANYGDASKIFTPFLNSDTNLYDITRKTISQFYL